MTIDDLRELAENADDSIVLVLPPPACQGERIRLCRTSGPFGEIICVHPVNQKTTAAFRSKDILAWCDKQG